MQPAMPPDAPPLSPSITAQLNYLLSHSPLAFKVDNIRSGGKKSRYSDRFTLLIPYCLDYIKWDVIYNTPHPTIAPDFIFEEEDEDFDPLSMIVSDGEMASKSNFRDWNVKDPLRLLALINELRVLYASYQNKKVGELDDPRLRFELNTILSREGIEVCMISSPDRPEEVRFAVPLLDMDLNKMVPGCPWRQQQKIHLQVAFPVNRTYASLPAAPRIKLISTPELKALFSLEDVKLPPWSNDMCMAEYLPIIEENLNIQIVEAIASIGARRRFVEALATLFGRPLEADPVFCRRASFLCASGTFTLLVHFSIPSQFPKLQPVITMQSSQHFDALWTPIASPPINDYPWSPRWDPAQMAERIFEFLVDESLNFKKHCLDSIPL